MVQSNASEIFTDYNFLTNLTSGQDLRESLTFFDGLNDFIPFVPQVPPPNVDDVFKEFDDLIQFWKIETAIGSEDGRPFAYEVDKKFMDTVFDQCIELTLIPYDMAIFSEVNQVNDIGGYPGSLGLDSAIMTLASISGTSKALPRSKMMKIRKADWPSLKLYPSNLTASESSYRNFLQKLVEIDMELKIELDTQLLSDNETIMNHIKQCSKKAWDKSASVPNCRPLRTKLSIIPQYRDTKRDDDPQETRHPQLFDFGFKIPNEDDSRARNQILAEKRALHERILKANDESKQLEKDESESPKLFTDISAASIFAEHELLAMFQLRYIKVRDCRIKILRQLNYFRSIEKRLVMNLAEANLSLSKNPYGSTAASLADMWIMHEFFDPSGSEKNGWQDTSSEDTREVQDGRIYISDRRGISFVYGTPPLIQILSSQILKCLMRK